MDASIIEKLIKYLVNFYIFNQKTYLPTRFAGPPACQYKIQYGSIVVRCGLYSRPTAVGGPAEIMSAFIAIFYLGYWSASSESMNRRALFPIKAV
jgi:hypothetical protein